MHILTFILIFIFGAIAAACKGDYSGIVAIGKFMGVAILFFAMLWFFTQPVLLVIVIIVMIIIAAGCLNSRGDTYELSGN